MKPLNYDNSPCSPTSSNCVIWQGPDLHIIKLCKGDTISDVIASLATELAIVMDQLSITNYDLSCFNLVGCKPETYQELLQFLIEQICLAQGISPTTIDSKTNDILITVAPCFIVNGITVMSLTDYVTAIGLRICSIIDQITIINDTLNLLNIRVTDLENAVPYVYTLPDIPADCILAPGSYPIDQVINELMNNDTLGYCALLSVTGTPANLISSVLSQCILNTDLRLSTGTAFSTAANWEPLWNTLNVTVAASLRNIWVVLCDIYTYLNTLKSVVVAAGDGISVTSATVGNVITYTVSNDYLETFVANLTIDNIFIPVSGTIPLVTPASVDGITDGQTIERYTQVSSDSQSVIAGVGTFVPNANLPTISFGSFNNTTGVFTINDSGTYLIKATIHLKPNNTSSVFWSGTATFSGTPTVNELEAAFLALGSFYIGVTADNTTDVYVADSQTLTPSIDRNIEISTSKVIVTDKPIALKVKVLNTTNRNYNGKAYTSKDEISFSIIKLREDLTITQL